ncbi:MAG: hypothetical protein NTW96_09610 [Planctomycetia bacterium]|nr:hypothetical protein [Planctomycetia bacterium]
MNALVNEPQPDLGVGMGRDSWPLPKDDARAQVRARIGGLLTTLCPRSGARERRRDQRYPFPHLIHLTPVGEDGITPEGQSVVVVGKHLSERGVGFYHPKPLPYRRMIASLEAGAGVWMAFLIDLSWCRFTKEGWYESGGRFLQVVPSPVGPSGN